MIVPFCDSMADAFNAILIAYECDRDPADPTSREGERQRTNISPPLGNDRAYDSLLFGRACS